MHRIQQEFTVNYSYPVVFTRDLFASVNTTLPELLQESGQKHNRALVVIDSEVARLTAGLLDRLGQFSNRYQPLFDIVAPPLIVNGGEACKREHSVVDRIHAQVERHALCRHSFVVAIGGGAVLDTVGYATATAHRGLRLIRVPTTTLAQNDAGVGVKNGINAFERKNFLGTFAPPFAVINDFDFLKSLPDRELRAGIAEAIKVALIRDSIFFDELYRSRKQLKVFASNAMERMITRCAELHLEHISSAGDPFEYGSSRPLDFGHWNAHKLEELTGGELRHGEAVAIGIALDSLYSHHCGLLSEFDLHRIVTLLEEIGFALYHPALSWLDVDTALKQFQEHLGGELSIPLLPGIGRKTEVHQIDIPLMEKCIRILAERTVVKPELVKIEGITYSQEK